MIADITTIVWKEWKEMLLTRGNLRGGFVGVLVMLAVFGIFMPLNSGAGWVTSPSVLLYWTWIPLFLVSNVVADSFAGERERHTLETLLASRLPDRAILWGKVAAAVGYAWGLTLASVALGVITVNLAHHEGGFLFYSGTVAVAIVVLSFLGALVAAAAGVLVSLRAASVRQAQQTLSLAILAVLFVPLFGVRALPAATQARVLTAVAGTSITSVLIAAVVTLGAIAALLLAIAGRRFRRSRLILA